MRSEELSLEWELAQEQWERLVLVGASAAAELALQARAAAGGACLGDPFCWGCQKKP